MYVACSGGVVVVTLRDLVASEFSVRRSRGGNSVILLSSYDRDYEKLRVRLVNGPNSLKFEF